MAQAGISSKGYQPGPYSNREELLLALDRFVLERTGGIEQFTLCTFMLAQALLPVLVPNLHLKNAGTDRSVLSTRVVAPGSEPRPGSPMALKRSLAWGRITSSQDRLHKLAKFVCCGDAFDRSVQVFKELHAMRAAISAP